MARKLRDIFPQSGGLIPSMTQSGSHVCAPGTRVSTDGWLSFSLTSVCGILSVAGTIGRVFSASDRASNRPAGAASAGTSANGGFDSIPCKGGCLRSSPYSRTKKPSVTGGHGSCGSLSHVAWEFSRYCRDDSGAESCCSISAVGVSERSFLISRDERCNSRFCGPCEWETFCAELPGNGGLC